MIHFLLLLLPHPCVVRFDSPYTLPFLNSLLVLASSIVISFHITTCTLLHLLLFPFEGFIFDIAATRCLVVSLFAPR
jgi:hypothetical protein